MLGWRVRAGVDNVDTTSGTASRQPQLAALSAVGRSCSLFASIPGPTCCDSIVPHLQLPEPRWGLPDSVGGVVGRDKVVVTLEPVPRERRVRAGHPGPQRLPPIGDPRQDIDVPQLCAGMCAYRDVLPVQLGGEECLQRLQVRAFALGQARELRAQIGRAWCGRERVLRGQWLFSGSLRAQRRSTLQCASRKQAKLYLPSPLRRARPRTATRSPPPR